MKRMRMKMWSCILMVIMLITVITGCKKNNEKDTATAGKSTSSVKSSVKTATKSTSGTKTATDAGTETETETGYTGDNDDVEDEIEENGNDNEDPSAVAGSGWAEGLKFNPDAIDLGGRTIIISSWDVVTPNSELEAISNRIFGRSEITDKRILRQIKAEEKFNCKIKYEYRKSDENYKTKIITNLMGGVYFADLVGLPSSGNLPDYYLVTLSNGILQPLDDILDFNNPKWEPTRNIAKWVDGRTYAINYNDKLERANPLLTIYNPKMLEINGLEEPYKLDMENRWDWEAYMEIAKQCTRDLNGDGIIDQFGISSYNLVAYLLTSNNVIPVKVENDNLKSDLFTPAALRAFNFYRDLTFIHKVCDNAANVNQMLDNFDSGKVAMECGDGPISIRHVTRGNLNFGLATMPKGPDMSDANRYGCITLNVGLMTFPKNERFTTEELLAIHLYAGPSFALDDKDDPETYIPWETMQINDRMKLGLTQEQAEFWVYAKSNMDKNYLSIDYSSGIVGLPALLNNNVYKPLANGESVGALLESVRSQVENMIENYIK